MIIWEVIFWVSICAVLYPYIAYPLLLLTCRLFVREDASHDFDASYLPKVSIILAAHNEEKWIRAKIENCLQLDYPRERYRILIGSDDSSDRTNEIASEYEERGVEVFAFAPRRGKMATVNRLVREATGEICVFSDISELFERDAVRKLVRHFTDPKIGAVTGNHIYNTENSGLGSGTKLYWKFQRLLQRVESRLYSVCQCDGTIYSCRRECFPYPDDSTINDDVAVALGVLQGGKRVIFDSQAIVRGDVLAESRQFFRQKVRGQAGRYQIFSRFRAMFTPWPFVRWWIFVSHCVMPVAVPWFLILALSSNAALWFSEKPMYRTLFVLQILFYVCAAIGYLAERSRVHLRVASVPFYFVMANLGSLCGFFVYLFGRQKAAWKKVQ